MSLSETWVSSLILLSLALVLLLLFTAILRNLMLAAAVASLFLVLFFSYAYVYEMLFPRLVAYSATNQSLVLMLVWVILFIVGTGVLFKIKDRMHEVTRILNIIALTLVVIPLFRIGIHECREKDSRQGFSVEPFRIAQANPVRTEMLPNIYYIVLDAYGRSDVLEEVYRYDNSEFLGYLKQKGFFIAERSQANYAQTELSLASSLNLSYLDDLAAHVGLESTEHLPLWGMIQNSAVTRFLRQHGYTIIGLDSGYSHTDLKTADVHVGLGQSWNELEIRLLCSTPIPWLAIRGRVFDPYDAHRRKILFTLDHIADMSELPSPHFVFAHVLAPHGPFVFDEHGNEVWPRQRLDLRDEPYYNQDEQAREDYLKGYKGQLTFINSRIRSVLDDLLSETSRPTIVILQADHGPGSLVNWDVPDENHYKEKLAILNAYLLPREDAVGLYQEITPVNTFRLILNHYFGTELEQLEDESYFSSRRHPYEFINVTDDVRSETSVSPSD
jgi:hypothetical protein